MPLLQAECTGCTGAAAARHALQGRRGGGRSHHPPPTPTPSPLPQPTGTRPAVGPTPLPPAPLSQAGQFSFCCFPLKNKTADASLGPFPLPGTQPKNICAGTCPGEFNPLRARQHWGKEAVAAVPPHTHTPPAPHHSLTRGLTIDGPAGGAEELTPALPPRRGCAGTRPRGGVGLLGKDPPPHFPALRTLPDPLPKSPSEPTTPRGTPSSREPTHRGVPKQSGRGTATQRTDVTRGTPPPSPSGTGGCRGSPRRGRTWFMTLPKSIRGLSCLHPKGPAALPHLAEGRGGRPGGCRGGGVGGKREPSVGRREGGLQAEPPSLPGTSPEKEGRKEGGRREGRERRGEGGGESRRVSLPAGGTPAMEGSPQPPLAPPHPQGRRLPGGAMGRPRPWGREGGPGWLFSTAPLPPLSSHSLSSLPSLRRAPSRTRTRPAPLPSPPPKTPLKATGSRAPPRAPSPEMRRAPPRPTQPGGPGRRGRALIAPRDAAASLCPWRGGGRGTGVGPGSGPLCLPPPGRGRFAKCKEGAQKVALGCSPGCLRGVKVYHSSSMESKGMEKPCTVGVPRGPTSRPTAPHLSSPTPSPSSAVRIGVRAPGTTAQPALQWPTERQTGRGGLRASHRAQHC